MMICGVLLGMATFAQAQNTPGQMGGGRMAAMLNPEARVKQLDEKLKLSDEQKTKLTAIFTDQAASQKKLREEMQGGNVDRTAMREKMMASRKELEEKINGTLNADQKKAYQAMLDEQRAEMQKRMQERNQDKK